MKVTRPSLRYWKQITRVAPLLGPFQTALKNRAMEQLEGMIGTLRVYTLQTRHKGKLLDIP